MSNSAKIMLPLGLSLYIDLFLLEREIYLKRLILGFYGRAIEKGATVFTTSRTLSYLRFYMNVPDMIQIKLGNSSTAILRYLICKYS